MQSLALTEQHLKPKCRQITQLLGQITVKNKTYDEQEKSGNPNSDCWRTAGD